MALGPVQLVVLGFDQPDFRAAVAAELERLGGDATVRVIDSLVVYKDMQGDLEVAHMSDVTTEEADELGTIVGTLIGLAVEGEDAAGPPGGARDARAEPGGWDVVEDIPRDTAAVLVLLEHRWAIPLRDTIAHHGGYSISDGFINPLDLVEVGLLTAEEASKLDALELGGRP